MQSVTIGSGLFIVGMLLRFFGVQADISSKHRLLTDETLLSPQETGSGTGRSSCFSAENQSSHSSQQPENVT